MYTDFFEIQILTSRVSLILQNLFKKPIETVPEFRIDHNVAINLAMTGRFSLKMLGSF